MRVGVIILLSIGCSVFVQVWLLLSLYFWGFFLTKPTSDGQLQYPTWVRDYRLARAYEFSI